jgi:hypothetical protein
MVKRLFLLLCGTFLCVGCAASGDKAQWDAFWQDVRGENMQMKGTFSATDPLDSHAPSMQGRD